MEKNTTEKYFNNRIKKLRDRFSNEGIDSIIIFKDENIYYLTGFYARQSESILIVTKKEINLLVHFIYFEQAKKTVVLEKIRISKFISNKKEKYKEIMSSEDGGIAGVESNSIDYETYISNKRMLTMLGWKVKNLPAFVDQQRIIKDEFEISAIRRSCSITDAVIKDIYKMDFAAISEFSEKGLALFIETGMIKRNSEGRSFDLIVASTTSSSLPHYIPTSSRIKSGLLLFDIGCIYKNYCSDITRTVFILNEHTTGSKVKNVDKLKKIYDIVLQAQLKALDKCREGISCRELDSVAREHVSKMGYGEYFGHGLGHGVGLEVHEHPKVSLTVDETLKENMVITIEPGIYLEDIGGVRIEDMVIVKKNGCENLYSCSKAFTVID